MAKAAGLTVRELEALQPRDTAYEVKDDAEAGLYVTVLLRRHRSSLPASSVRTGEARRAGALGGAYRTDRR